MTATAVISILTTLLTGVQPAGKPPARPNIVIILADDLGFSDLGCYGGEIRTPNLDGLAARGLRFTQFYNTARCWPTRAALLTGYYAQQVRRDTVPGIPSGGRGIRPGWAKLLPELLRPLGYRSYHSGKWHIDGKPLANGFDRSYLLEDVGRYFRPRVHFEDDQKLPPAELGSGYYATTAIADHGIKYLSEHGASMEASRSSSISPSMRPISLCKRRRTTLPGTAGGTAKVGRPSARTAGSGFRPWDWSAAASRTWSARLVRRTTSRMPCEPLAPARSTGRCPGERSR